MDSTINFTRPVVDKWLFLRLNNLDFVFEALEFIMVGNWLVVWISTNISTAVLVLGLDLAWNIRVISACRCVIYGVHFVRVGILSIFKHSIYQIVFFLRGFLDFFCTFRRLCLAFGALGIGNLFEFAHVGFATQVVLQQ